MKKLLFFVVSLFLINAQTLKAETAVTYEEADPLTQARLRIYLQVYGYEADANDPLSSVDEHKLYLSEIKNKGETYDYVQFFSGDAPTGGLFTKNSLALVGAHGDGDFWLFGQNWLEKKSRFKSIKKVALLEASQIVKDQLLLWLQVTGQKQLGDTKLTGVFDDDSVKIKQVTYKNLVYDYLQVSVGDGNIAGPLFKQGTLQLEGESSDGALYLYSQEFFTPSQLPDHEGILHCELHSQYLDLTKTFDFDLNNDDNLLGNGPEGDKWVISWSQSECEDNTSISFDLKEFKALLAGEEEKIWGSFKHEEPDLDITGTVECSLKKTQ